MKPKTGWEDAEIEEDIGDLETGLRPSLANERRTVAAPPEQQPSAGEEDPDQVPTSLLALPPQLVPPGDPQRRIETPPVGFGALESSDGEVTEPAATPLRRLRGAESARANRSVGRKVFTGLLKGSLVAGLMLGSAWLARVATIEETRQQLAASSPEPAESEPAAAAHGPADEPSAAPETGSEAALAQVGGPAVDAPAGLARTPDAGAGDEDAGAVVDAGTDNGRGAGKGAPQGFGMIVVKGRGRVLIDGKPCRAPCAVKVSAGDHVVSRKGGRRFKKTISVEPGEKEIVRIQ